MNELFTDGGVVKINPSPIAGNMGVLLCSKRRDGL